MYVFSPVPILPFVVTLFGVFLVVVGVFRQDVLLNPIDGITDIPTHVLSLRVAIYLSCIHLLVVVGTFRHASAAAGRRPTSGNGE
jgi:hypothetical protein